MGDVKVMYTVDGGCATVRVKDLDVRGRLRVHGGMGWP